MSEHGTRQWIADGDPKPSSRMPKGSCPQHPFAQWCEHGGVLTGTRPIPTTPSHTPRRAGHTVAEDHRGFLLDCPACARWQAFLAERLRRIAETGE